MKFILKYYTESKYLHFEREYYKEFKSIKDLKDYLFANITKISHYLIYRLSDLTGK